jgi:hypothetical protein
VESGEKAQRTAAVTEPAWAPWVKPLHAGRRLCTPDEGAKSEKQVARNRWVTGGDAAAPPQAAAQRPRMHWALPMAALINDSI